MDDRTDEGAAEAAAWLAKLEALRRSVDLRLDAEGRWFHEGAPFEHAGLIAAFDRGLDLHPESGEPILRVGGRWCYVRADDTPFVVRRLSLEDGRLVVRLNTGAVEPVPPAGFEAAGDRLYVQLGRRRARLGRAAQAKLGQWLVEGDGGWVVAAGDGRWPVREVEGAEGRETTGAAGPTPAGGQGGAGSPLDGETRAGG